MEDNTWVVESNMHAIADWYGTGTAPKDPYFLSVQYAHMLRDLRQGFLDFGLEEEEGAEFLPQPQLPTHQPSQVNMPDKDAETPRVFLVRHGMSHEKNPSIS